MMLPSIPTIRSVLVILVLLQLSSCAMYHTAPLANAEDNVQNAGATSDKAPASKTDLILLTNSQWQLVQIQSMDDSTYTPDDPGKYSLSFMPEGQLGVKADCNSGGGHWTLLRKNQIEFSQLISTLALCPADSLSDRLMQNLTYVRSFVFRDGHLFLATMADGAILEFKPADENNNAQNKPAFDCGKAEGAVETQICNTPTLAKLDLQVDQLYQAALMTFPKEEIDTLKAIQRGWISGRNDCWKDAQIKQCIESSYDTRITQLQIRTGYFMVPEVVIYQCDSSERLAVYFYNETKIPTAVINDAGAQFFAYQTTAASGAKYQGRNELLWIKGNEAQWQMLDKKQTCTVQ